MYGASVAIRNRLVYGKGAGIAVMRRVGRVWLSVGRSVADLSVSLSVSFHLDDVFVCAMSLVVHVDDALTRGRRLSDQDRFRRSSETEMGKGVVVGVVFLAVWRFPVSNKLEKRSARAKQKPTGKRRRRVESRPASAPEGTQPRNVVASWQAVTRSGEGCDLGQHGAGRDKVSRVGARCTYHHS